MNKILFSLTITTIAGLSTLLGLIPCFFKNANQDKIINFSLSFASGIMLTISLLSLIPEGYKLLNNYLYPIPLFIITLIFITTGLFFSSSIDKHLDKKLSNNQLYKLGIISIIALILHNIPEGITTFMTTTSNTKLGLTLSLAIALHNIPEGISIAVPIYYSTKNLKKAFFYTLLSGFSETLGAFLALIFLKNYINDFIIGIILIITAGIMLHISLFELFPNAKIYKENKLTTAGITLGIIVMYICTKL